MRRRLWIVGIACLVALTARGIAPAGEEKVALDKVPKAALDVVKAKFPGAKLFGASKEKEGATLVYEIELTYKDHHHDVTLEAGGKIVSIEREIARKELPAGVDRAVENKYPKAKWKIVEELLKGDGTLTGYEILLETRADGEVEVVVDPKGKITKEEKQKQGDKD